MDYENVVRDFAVRTQKNLRFVEEYVKQRLNESDPQVYEVTQHRPP